MARFRKTGKIWCEAAAAGQLIVAHTNYFSIEPNSLFARVAPLEIEIGAGSGDFILARAGAMPHTNFLAIELSLPLARVLAGRAFRAALQNLRVVRSDARPIVNLFLPCGCVSAYHIYFPDPWPKMRHAKHRLFTSCFVANLRRTMVPGGSLYVATDVHSYAESVFAMVSAQLFQPACESAAGPSSTRFARKFIAEGRTIYARTFIKQAAAP